MTKAKTNGSSRGLNGACWGGGLAPLFIKAGELFKDGEVDVITHEEGQIFRAYYLRVTDSSNFCCPQIKALMLDITICRELLEHE